MSTIQEFISVGTAVLVISSRPYKYIDKRQKTRKLASAVILTLSGHLVLNSQLICHHRYEFTIGWFGLTDINGVTEQV